MSFNDLKKLVSALGYSSEQAASIGGSKHIFVEI